MKYLQRILAFLFLAMSIAGCSVETSTSGSNAQPAGPNGGNSNGGDSNPPGGIDDFKRFPRNYYLPGMFFAERDSYPNSPYLNDTDYKTGYRFDANDLTSIYGCIETEKELTFVEKTKGADGSLIHDMTIKAYSSVGYHESVIGSMFPYRTYPRITIKGYIKGKTYEFDTVVDSCLFEAHAKREKNWTGNIFCKNVKAKNVSIPVHFFLRFDCEFVK